MTHIRQRRDSAVNWTTGDPVLQLGEVGWETDTRKAKIGDGTTAWTGLAYIVEEGVTSVNGMDGDVTLVKSDIGLGNVDNTPDTAKPISTSQQAALDDKADLDSPVFTGNPTAPTPSAGDADTSIATTSFVDIALADFAGATVTMTNKDLTDDSNTFPPSLGQVVAYGTSDADVPSIVSFNTVVEITPVDEIDGAVYRVTGFVEVSSDTIDGYSSVTIENARTGGPTIQIAESLKNHSIVNRREGVAVIGIYEGTLDVETTFWLSVTPGGGGTSRVRGDLSPSVLVIERIG